MDKTLKKPILSLQHQALPHWILPHIGQFFLIFDSVAHPMMKRSPLPGPRLIQMAPAELALPKLNPLINAEVQVAWRAEEMQVIRHQQIISHQPCRRLLAPYFYQGLLHHGVSHPRDGILRVHGYEENVWLPEKDVRTTCWSLPANIWMDAFASGHEGKREWTRHEMKA